MEYKNDDTLFKWAAWYYANFRRGYPKSFYDHIRDGSLNSVESNVIF